MVSIIAPGVNFGVPAFASKNGETVDDSPIFDDDDVGDDGFAPNGRQRLRFAGR